VKLIKYTSNVDSFIDGSRTETILDLGHHGFADSFFAEKDVDRAGDSVPLVCQIDKQNGLIQLLNQTHASERYGVVDYSYTSSNSLTARIHWENYVADLSNYLRLERLYILEIGSNDGYLLKLLNNQNNQVLGVDASRFMANYATLSGIVTLHGIFGESEELINEIIDRSPKYNAIFANNVLNHSNNLIDFVKTVKKLLSPDGIFVIEVPYWSSTIESLHFDQIYHEHLSYLTVKAAKIILHNAGLEIVNVKVVDYHGGSLRIIAKHESNSESLEVDDMIIKETNLGLFSIDTYVKYFSDITKKKNEFMGKVHSYHDAGKTLFGIGAAAKANTLLTFYGLNCDILDFIVDASKFKHNKITPVTKIPIFPDSKVVGILNSTGIILAWNLNSEVRKNILLYNERVEFLTL
jgi:2-polyprenyl-3-methyl-5-hydroxy-6-metoxy-1,4-benzoquinol methylase